jgi:hypothetical protein
VRSVHQGLAFCYQRGSVNKPRTFSIVGLGQNLETQSALQPKNICETWPAISVEVGVRDIERIPEASILTNHPPFRYSPLAATGSDTPEFGLALQFWQSFVAFLRVNGSRIYSSITFP